MDTSSLNTVLDSLGRTSKGQLAYARDPLSACSTLDSKSFTISRESGSFRGRMLLSERYNTLETPSIKNERLLDGSIEPWRNYPGGTSQKQMNLKEITLLSNSVNKDETTPVYNMSYETMLKLFEETEALPQVSLLLIIL